LRYTNWFAQPATQKKWWEGGGFTCHQAILNAPGFETSTPYAKVFLDSMKVVKDFWAEPLYARLLSAMQNRVHDYVVVGTGCAQETLDQLARDWEEVFKSNGRIK